MAILLANAFFDFYVSQALGRLGIAIDSDQDESHLASRTIVWEAATRTAFRAMVERVEVSVIRNRAIVETT